MSDFSIRGAFDRAITASGVLVGLAAFFIGLSVTYDVLAREILGSTTDWVVDVNTYLVAFITFIGAGYGLREEAHVSVDLLTRRLGPLSRRVLRLFSDAIILLITALFVWLGAKYCWGAWQSDERSFGLFSVPLWIPYACLPLGMALLFAVQVTRITDTLFGTRTDESPSKQTIEE